MSIRRVNKYIGANMCILYIGSNMLDRIGAGCYYAFTGTNVYRGVMSLAALSASQRKANEKYIKANYSQVKLSMPNAEAEALDAYCKAHGLTKAGFIREAIKEKMERDQ